ncbi:hypothetical protein MSPP1_002691 [Malassezia sp. CBS 17886]|nr:hypothetical protein MSPP1_002691 [Malassezia sp. CBS 17886]
MARKHASDALVPYLYHERQEGGSMLCAQHALNAVLQGNFFDATQLAQIAVEIAEYEQAELGMSHEHAPAHASHMDDTGFFSVEVLDRAFRTWDLSLVRWQKYRHTAERMQHPENEFAFVLNLGSHWLSLRGFGRGQRQWQAESEGYSVFVVELQSGAAPPDTIADDFATSLHPAQNAFGQARADTEDDDRELQAALQASLGTERDPARSLVEPSTGHVRMPRSCSSPLQSTPRRRGREPVSGSEEESDAHVDAIAPCRHRARSSAGAHRRPSGSRDAAAVDAVRQRRQSGETAFAGRDGGVMPRAAEEGGAAWAGTSTAGDTVAAAAATGTAPVFDGDAKPTAHPLPLPEDDEEQLQAVIAASLGQPYQVSERVFHDTQRRLHPGAVGEERDAVPADVERIRRLRSQAADEQRAGAAPEGEKGPSPDADAPRDPAGKAAEAPSDAAPPRSPDGDDPSDTDDGQEPSSAEVSPEEMRRRRLARFGI